jgi:hypothetical protein
MGQPTAGSICAWDVMVQPSIPLALLLTALLLVACSRPIERPRDGAQVDISGRSFQPDSGPPTLVPPSREPARVPPTVRIQPPTVESTAVAARPPEIKQLDPLPDAQVFAGNVRFMMQITATSALSEVLASLDGSQVRPVIGQRSATLWSVSFVRNLQPGTHQVQVHARDQGGLSGQLDWRFEVIPGVGDIATPAEAPPAPAGAATSPPREQPTAAPANGNVTPAPRPPAQQTPAPAPANPTSPPQPVANPTDPPQRLAPTPAPPPPTAAPPTQPPAPPEPTATARRARPTREKEDDD